MNQPAASAAWRFLGSCLDGEAFLIAGLNVWQQEWENLRRTALVEDPIYHAWKHFGVYRIASPAGYIEFAAGEFSNCVWCFYRQQR